VLCTKHCVKYSTTAQLDKHCHYHGSAHEGTAAPRGHRGHKAREQTLGFQRLPSKTMPTKYLQNKRVNDNTVKVVAVLKRYAK
jgi:hypothetical protein